MGLNPNFVQNLNSRILFSQQNPPLYFCLCTEPLPIFFPETSGSVD